ncbi:MAG: glutamine-hydrolyzing GMP synthase [Bdellovibrionales bacterium]|nr:glutamine-hydrolyzing GMP synthase [Bdellovibrionales bacterium]
MQHDTIAVVDFGGQYAHLIATKLRLQNIHAEIRQPEDPIEAFTSCKGIILSGSPALSSHGEDSEYNKAIYDLDIPILGFCFGHQEIAKHYGGTVVNAQQEWGRAQLHILLEHPLMKGLDRVEQVWMSHNDTVASIGPDFEELGYSVLDKGEDEHRFAAIVSDKLRRYGFQYHPEVDDTIHGDEMIRNFAYEICGCKPSWTLETFLEDEIEAIRQQVGDESVFLLASGGVDSTVAARILGEALGPERLHLLHVDNGLMRKDESKQVIESFHQMGLDKNLHFIDATEDFLSALDGLVEPEDKRHAIGKTFVDVFEREARKLGMETHLLGQGTIYPDTIETGGTKRADTIKTHHNRVPIIEEMIAAGKVVEPLAELYKTEVRNVGLSLDIPEEMIWRHPFPGPGLGVRLLCSDGSAIPESELAPLQNDIEKALTSYPFSGKALPLKSVGVKADLRTYEHPVLLEGLRQSNSQELDFKQLEKAAGLIYKTVRGINRCICNLAPQMPQTFNPRKGTVTRERLDLLREADHIVMEGLKRYSLYDKVWQCPTVIVPLTIDGKDGEFCIIRPIETERAMSAVASHLPGNLLAEVTESILALPGIVGLAYDITTKPPGTIEWE